VTEALEIEQDHLGRRVGVPVLHQVVAGDVGTVTGRDERRQPEPTPRRGGQDRDAQGTGLAEEPHPSGAGDEFRQGRVELDIGGGVDHAQCVGPHHAHTVGAGLTDQATFGHHAGTADIGESGRDHDECRHALGQAVVEYLGHDAAGTATTARSTGSGMSRTLGYERTDCTEVASEFTGYTGPEKPLAMRLRNTVWPILPTWSDAPITATEPGLSTRATLRASAAASREFRTLASASVGSMANSRCRLEPSNDREISY